MRIGGKFNGTGADVYICCGFVPDFVKVWNIEGATPLSLEWNVGMTASVLCNEGILRPADGGATQDLANGEGLKPYQGGDLLTTTTQSSVTYGEGVYLVEDSHDYRRFTTGGVIGDAVAVDITTWTLYSAYTGHFNEDVNGTYIGEGSRIMIDGKWYTIVVLAGASGEATSEVTLNETGVPSGNVEAIYGMYGFKPLAVGKVTPAGFRISNTTLNANDKTIVFEAGTYGR